MSITKISETEWEVVFACNNYNGDFEVEVTAEGISINFNLISWAEIDAAREAVRSATQEAYFHS